jgi:hypothetical protein
MFKRTLSCIALLLLVCSCRTGVDIPGAPDLDISQLEERVRDVAPDGEEALRVVPAIDSIDELMAYRELKRAEAREILALTEEEAEGRMPYFPVVVTMARSLSISEFNEMVSKYNPSASKSLKSPGFDSSAYLAKAHPVDGDDRVLPRSIRFNSSTGKGQLHHETMADGEQLSHLQETIAEKEKVLNGIGDFSLVDGITSFVGGVHRENVISLYDDARVFIADIGPIELYRGDVTYAFWDDVSDSVQKYLGR